ncbi:hypothetical protein [Geobacter anodireducens]|uniref:Uncharacterized protein n=1 Tax=Geobacter anodireducens TaxID=1340425 RepID=A0ABR9NTD9_9BACT|nr:hypothetical protein [Geobacter anodireducens]ANA39777.1 hypothetical protein A2G06_04755 [Geobacter anodireducens]MBE2887521.1 hypothetical protein [Geobacter anodireducens]HMN01878.1 hypothetical protein [Geobacter anodireducens]
MGIVPTDNLEEGMVLAADVHDRTGRLLLGAGVELDRKRIVILMTWGVTEADILGGESDSLSSTLPSEFPPALMEAAEAELRPLFGENDMEHPVMRELLRLAALRKVIHGNP